MGLLVLAFLFAVDLVLGPSTIVTGTFLMAPFVCAQFGSARGTALVAVLALCLAAASPLWQTDAGVDYVVRLAAIAVSGVLAVAGARARDRSSINAGRLRLLDAISEIADGSLPLTETLSRATELIVPEAADMCMIDAVHEGRVVRAAVRVEGVPDAGDVEERLRRRTPSIPGRFVALERAWMQIAHFRPRMDAEDLRRMAQDPEDLAFLQSLRPRSSIIAAMTARGRNLGTLTLVTAWSKRRYTADDVSFAQVLANRLGLALDSAGLFSDLESVERRLDTVMSMLDEAIAVHDASGDLVYANDTAARWLGFTRAQEVLEATEQELMGRLEVWAEDGTRLDHDLIARRFREGRLPRGEHVRIALQATDEELWAVVSSEPINAPDGSLLYAVTTIEDVTQLKRSEFTQQLLARAGELFGASTDYHQTVQAVSRVAVPQLADWCSVNIPDETGTPQQVALAHRDPEMVAWARRWSDRYPLHMDERSRLMESDSLGSTVAVPMTAGAKIVGVLVFGNDPGSRSFDQSDLEIAGEIARRAGIAVENARLAGEQADVARVLQRGLRPAQLPAMRGFEVATMYRPAGEVNEVGGDFYEAFEIEGGWMLAIGDVMGRGAAAASRDGSGSLHDPHRGQADRRSPLGRTDARREPQAGHGPLAVQRDHHGAPRQRRRSRASVAARRRASPAAARSRRNGGTGGTARTAARRSPPAKLGRHGAGAVARRSARPVHRRRHRGSRREGSLRRGPPARELVHGDRSVADGGADRKRPRLVSGRSAPGRCGHAGRAATEHGAAADAQRVARPGRGFGRR